MGGKQTPEARREERPQELWLEDLRAALDQLRRTRRASYNEPEEFSASLEEAEVLLRLNRHEDALAAFQRSLRLAGAPSEYSNVWVSLNELKKRLFAAYRQFVVAQAFVEAARLALLIRPLLSGEDSAELRAETYYQWGVELRQQIKGRPPLEVRLLERQAREHFTEAGDAYAMIARNRKTTRHYTEDLWKSAECYLKAHDFRLAPLVLKAYLKHESPQSVHPEAYVGLGESYLAAGNAAKAISFLRLCIEFHPHHPATHTARLLISTAHLEQGDFDSAEKALLGNLQSRDLNPSSPEWRDSLFALGRLFHLSEQWPKAVARLEEAVARYPNHPQVAEASYLLADSFMRSARELDAPDETAVESVRIAHDRSSQHLLTSALKHMEASIAAMQRRQETLKLTQIEKTIQRNAYFSRAAILFQLGRYQEALSSYSTVINRYQNTPAVLEAYVQIAASYRELNQPSKARSAVAQAKAVLGRLPKDSSFKAATSKTRRQWTAYLVWLAEL